MDFSIRQIIRGLVVPSAVIRIAPSTWNKLIRELNARSDGRRESGAFLVGKIHKNGYRVIYKYILYDDLDPRALEKVAIYFHSVAYGELWNACREINLKVVADIHTHPGYSVAQSITDQTHPMISLKGHIAIIIPLFGRPPVKKCSLGVFRYLGSHQWETLQNGQKGSQALYIGWW